MSTFTGSAVNVFAATVIASGLRLYARTGIKPNRAYTPSAMMRMAAKVTGRKFKARDYLGAAKAIDDWKDAYMASLSDPSTLTVNVESFN